mmetsp:Transcript_15226/g.35284  ORF Transcript_15226/g.35284 Transcript_15226/m.35284 type:complete len:170 (+) Transcript_15226:1221-1730(+)
MPAAIVSMLVRISGSYVVLDRGPFFVFLLVVALVVGISVENEIGEHALGVGSVEDVEAATGASAPGSLSRSRLGCRVLLVAGGFGGVGRDVGGVDLTGIGCYRGEIRRVELEVGAVPGSLRRLEDEIGHPVAVGSAPLVLLVLVAFDHPPRARDVKVYHSVQQAKQAED